MNTINIYLSSGEEFVDFGSKLKSDYLQSEETARLSKRLGKLINDQPADTSCKEYLIDRLSLSRPEIDREQAERIVTEFMLGVDNYNRDYAAIESPDSDEFLDSDEFTKLSKNYTAEMSIEEECSFKSNAVGLFKGFRGSDIDLTLERCDTIVDREAFAELIATEGLGYYLAYITYNGHCLEDQDDEVHETVTPYLAGLASGATIQYLMALDGGGNGNGGDGSDKDRIKKALKIVVGVLVFAFIAYLSVTFLLPVISMAMPFLNMLLGVFLSGACVLYTILIGSFGGMLAYLVVDKIIDWYEKITKNDKIEARKPNESSTKDKEINKISKTMTTLNLTEAEFKVVQDLITQCESFADSKKDFRENLIDFYISQRPGTHPADAEEIVEQNYEGIHENNENLKSVFKTTPGTGEVDVRQKLQDAGKVLDPKTHYNSLKGLYRLLQTMDEDNLDKNTMNFHKVVDTEEMPVDFVPTEDDINQLVNKINDKLKNPSIIINNTESIKEMVSNISATAKAAESIISDTEETLKQKQILALCTVIASKQHKLESLPSDTSVRQIAAGCAAGIDIKKVLDSVANGDCDESTAWTIIKVILGTLLLTAFIIAVFYGLAIVGGTVFVAVITALGGSVLAAILAALSTVVVISGGGVLSYKIAEKLGKFVQDKVIPWCKSVWEWLKGRSNKTNGDDDEDEDDNDSDNDSDNDKIRRS